MYCARELLLFVRCLLKEAFADYRGFAGGTYTLGRVGILLGTDMGVKDMIVKDLASIFVI